MPVEREQLRQGVYVRLLSNWTTVPAGTTGTVEILVNFGSRRVVMWDSYLHLPLYGDPKKTRRKVILPGLASFDNLKDEDLERFEVITVDEHRALMDAFEELYGYGNRGRGKKDGLPKARKPDQLTLPFTQSQAVRGTWWFVE